ncbi:pantothenate transporter [Aulographum hederae CBS 113979]|uniref:Pantothenate transporter n=1 Tax=Aulographum hederae CBS 113979 TaxID=1176131 RepID=A0A6G1GVL6_9PEZI|nr:pantothenate transporter [Aulographum hederae CBS 113979]
MSLHEKLGAIHAEGMEVDEKASETFGEVTWDEAEEKALVKKIDWRVFPMLCTVFGLSLLDRTNISAAYIAGAGRDLGLTAGTRYSVALLVFFIGYGLFEIPSNLVIRRLGARWWLSFLIISWGACVLGMGFIKTWEVLAVLRALLGMFEAGLFPGAVFIIGSWYKQYETAQRVSFFYMAALVASGFGPIIAYVLSLISVGNGMFAAGWRWIFIIEGIATIVSGFVAIFFLVDFPEKARWLTDRQRQIALTRVQIGSAARDFEHPNFAKVMRMLCNWKLGVFCLLYFIAAAGVYSLAFFAPIILRDGMGFDYTKAQLLSSPPYIFAIIASLCCAWLSDKYRIRWAILCGQALVGIIGLLIVLYTKPPGVRYFGLFLAVFGTQGNVPATLAYGQNQTPHVDRRGIYSAAMITIGSAGGVAGSTIFRSQDAPNYVPGMWTTLALQMLYIVVTFSMSMWMKRQNRRADNDRSVVLEGVESFRYAP